MLWPTLTGCAINSYCTVPLQQFDCDSVTLIMLFIHSFIHSHAARLGFFYKNALYKFTGIIIIIITSWTVGRHS